MRKISFLFTLLTTLFLQSQTLCESGFAGSYPCNGVDLMSHLTLADLNAGSGTDSWGWTDSTTNKEYALMGVNNGTCFVDITDPTEPIYLGKLPTHTASSSWRDIKVYNNHAYIVSEASGHGMQIFDLTRLRNVANPPETFTEDGHNNSFGSAHNIAINEDTGYAYVIGASPQNGGGIYFNLQDPTNPVNVGGYAAEGYSHDAQIITYNGPDTEHVGKELFFGFNAGSFVVVDVTDKANPTTISETIYPNVNYTHQGWLDENHTMLYINDEADEQNVGFNTRTIIFDATDLDNPTLKMEYFGTTPAIDHNYYAKGNKLYLANYRAGLRILDISDVNNSNVTELSFFDTFPNSDSANFNGAWNVYPFFESGNILISDIEGGLFVVRDTPLSVLNLDASTKFINQNLDCGITEFTPIIEVKNKGAQTLTSLDITYTLPGQSPVDIMWTGSLNQNETDTIDLANFILSDGENSFHVTCTNPNNGTDENTDNNSNTIIINLENYTTPNVNLELLTDDYGVEVTWTFKDNGGNVLYSGGPYDDNTTYNEVFVIPNDGCYTFEILDEFGDGICCSEGNGHYNLTTNNGTVIVAGGDYGTGETTEISIHAATSSINDDNLVDFSVSPNPTNGVLHINSNQNVVNLVELFDIMGKKITTYTLNEVNPLINVKNLNTGIYFIKINNNKTVKFIKK